MIKSYSSRVLAMLTMLAVCSCTPDMTAEQRAAHDAAVSKSLIESRHHWETSGSMSGPGNQ